MENGKGAFIRSLPTRYAVGSTEFHVLRPREGLDAGFLYYYTYNPVFREFAAENMSGAAGQKRVSSRFLKDTRIYLPPLQEQRRISDFLDIGCKAIDDAIEAKTRQLRVLEQLRSCVVTDFASGAVRLEGFPSGPQQSSHSGGTSTFGTAPSDWQIDRIRDRIGPIVGGEWGEDPATSDDGVEIAVVRVADIRGLDIKPEGLTIRRVRESKLPGRLIGVSTILLEKSGGGEHNPVGRAVQPRSLSVDAICSNFMAKFDCGPTVEARFILYLLHALYSTGVNGAHIQQTTGIQNLRVFDYLNSHVGIPLLQEQLAIAAHLDSACLSIKRIEDNINRQVDVLGRQRGVLIHEYVTGIRRLETLDAPTERQDG
jgi:restriction endonuclease S subunit